MEQNKPSVTPKDFFLWAGAMISLYTSVIAFLNLVFSYINYLYPDTLNNYWVDPYQSGISAYMATVIVALPLFVFLMRLIRKTITLDETRQDLWVRRWALVLTLFISAAAIIITFIVLLTTFLNGEEMTARFLLKVLSVILVAGTAFVYFLADIKGRWKTQPNISRNISYGVLVVVFAIVFSGFFIVGTPQDARLARYDAQKVSDLQNIQWQIVNYWQTKEKIPAKLADLSDPISNYNLPTDPQTKQSYEYMVSGKLSFQLCANFNAESRKMMEGGVQPTVPVSVMYDKANVGFGGEQSNWSHAAGRVCFDRTIDPERYPTQKSLKQ